VSHWQRYWFAPGGRHGAAVVRVAIACSILWTLLRLTSIGYAANPESAPTTLYRPVGILMLLGGQAPAAWLLEGLRWGAWAATLTMLVGWRTRTATVVSWVCAGSLACYEASFAAHWSHHNNVPFMAQLAFFAARGGDVWSVDAWLRRRRGLAECNVARAYQWSLRLVQLAVALMFFSAVLAKLYFGGFTPAWAISDNLRHQILARYDWIGVPRTQVADWLVGDVWRYRLAAAGNMLAQLTPVLAALLMKRPRLRALAGVVFVVETLALGVVMDLWNMHWLPLAAVFVDWDRLWQRGKGKEGIEGESAMASGSATETGVLTPSLPPHATAIRIFVALFLLYDLIVICGLDQRLRTYPFSAYPMFGYVRAKRPHDWHQTYEMPGTAIEILAAQPGTAAAQSWIDRRHTYRQLYKVRSVRRLRTNLEAMRAALQQRHPELGIEGVRVHFAAFQAPAYPAPAQLLRVPLGVLGELRGEELRSALGKVREIGGELMIEPQWTGMVPPAEVRYEAVVDYAIERRPLAVQPAPSGSGASDAGKSSDGSRVRAARPPGDVVLVLAVVGDTRYVVGEVGLRQW
jgi:hypothetical protein